MNSNNKTSSTTTGHLVVEGVVPCGMVVPPSFQQDGLEPLSPDHDAGWDVSHSYNRFVLCRWVVNVVQLERI